MSSAFTFVLILIIPGLIMFLIHDERTKAKKLTNLKDLSGFEVARRILDNNGLGEVLIVSTKGRNYYDYKRKAIKLTQDVFDGDDISSASIAAFTSIHAILDKNQDKSYKLFSSLDFVMNIVSIFSIILFILSIFLSIAPLMTLATVLLAIALIFYLVLLPMEMNAYKSALSEMQKYGLVTDLQNTNKMLKTYSLINITSLITSISYLLDLFKDNKR